VIGTWSTTLLVVSLFEAVRAADAKGIVKVSDEKRKKRSWNWIGSVVLAVAVLYPVSWGPAALLHFRREPEWSPEVFDTIYAPIDWARANSQTVDDWASWYAVVWIGDVQ
jgi:hypothetical protein